MNETIEGTGMTTIRPSTQIAVYQPIEAGIIEFLAKHENVVHDVTTTKGMEAARRDRAECRSLRVKLEDARVQEKAESLAYGRKVDAEATRIRVIIENAEDRYDAQIKAEEARKEAKKAEEQRIEAERIAGLRAGVDGIAKAPLAAIGKTSAQIAELLEQLRETIVDDSFAEFQDDARRALAGSLAQLELSRQSAAAQEAEMERIIAERKELARLREQDEARRVEERRKQEDEERLAAARRAEEEVRARAEREAEDNRRQQQEAKERAEREEMERKRRAEIAVEEERIRVAREAEQKRIDQERAELRRQQDEVDAKRRAEEARQREEDARQQAERDRIASERAAFEAEQKRAAAMLKARRGTAAIALSDIIGICRNANGYTDREARAEVLLIAEATLQQPKKRQAAA